MKQHFFLKCTIFELISKTFKCCFTPLKYKIESCHTKIFIKHEKLPFKIKMDLMKHILFVESIQKLLYELTPELLALGAHDNI